MIRLSVTLRAFIVVSSLVAVAGCDLGKLLKKSDQKSTTDDESETEESDTPKKKKKKKAEPEASASAAATSSAATVDATPQGPVVEIPAGTLLAGGGCGAVPRVTHEELKLPPVSLDAFSIDVYPYPNQAGVAPKTNVTQREAEGLCAERGKRLCTELEWERACKGTANATFEYGTNYDKDACKVIADDLPGKRAQCQTLLGVHDMHGLVKEWTASPWGRGKTGLIAVRGSAKVSNIVRERCASGEGRDPVSPSADVGFRCCSGPQNPDVVDLTLVREPPMTEDTKLDPELAKKMLAAMPANHRTADGYDFTFDKLWRWHPVDNEEMLLGRWIGRGKRGKPFYEIAVFKMCGGTVAKTAVMRGPVGKIASPRIVAGSGTARVELDVETKADKGTVKLSYWYGSVKVEEPAFIKAGNVIEAEEETTKNPILRPRLPVVKPKRL